MPDLYVDGDACPVKDEALRVAERHQLRLHLVSNRYLRLGFDHPLVNTVVVAEGMDEADNWIADNIQPLDICITNDIPLAARCIDKGGKALKPTGHPWTKDSIGNALATRNLMTHLREIGEVTGGPSGFTKQDRSRFLSALENMVQASLRGR